MMRISHISFVLLICTTSVHLSDKVEHNQVKRVLGGSKFSPNDPYFPKFTVQIKEGWGCSGNMMSLKTCTTNLLCGGSLVAADFILTACHCVVAKDISSLKPYTVGLVKSLFHPLYNSYILEVGSVYYGGKREYLGDLEDIIQRRHAINVFPHSLCWPMDSAHENVYDVALVRVEDNFELNEHVSLPRYDTKTFNFRLKQVVTKSMYCLYTGGPLYSRDFSPPTAPSALSYTFRPIQCNCFNPHHCKICSGSSGHFSSLVQGDSGFPVICNSQLFAIHYAGQTVQSVNFSITEDFLLTCLEKYLTQENFNSLRSLAHSTTETLIKLSYGISGESHEDINHVPGSS